MMCPPSDQLQERQMLEFKTFQMRAVGGIHPTHILLFSRTLKGQDLCFPANLSLSPLLEVGTWGRQDHHFLLQYEDCNVIRENKAQH